LARTTLGKGCHALGLVLPRDQGQARHRRPHQVVEIVSYTLVSWATVANFASYPTRHAPALGGLIKDTHRPDDRAE
jgi:hypothetical protein